MTPAELIANNLVALPHPDGTPRVLPGFSTQLLPETLHEQVGKTAKDIGDAIVNLLEINGYRITNEPEPAQTSTPALADSIANLHCNSCDTRLMQLNISNPSKVLTSGRMFIQGISSRNPECPHDAV